MKRFLKNSVIFILGLSLLFLLFFSVTTSYISKGDYFSVPKRVENIILGHSHSACAFNDSLIDGFYNLSQNTEGYPYSYFKLKKVLERNDHVRQVFVELTNNQITAWGENRVSGLYLDVNMPRSFPVMDASFVWSTLIKSKNPKRTLNALIQGNKSNAEFLLSGNDNYIHHIWKTHKTPSRSYQAPEIDEAEESVQPIPEIREPEVQTLGTNLEYLVKVIQLCQAKGVALYFVRSPMPPNTVIANEPEFQRFLKSKEIRNTPFLDFKEYPLPNPMFADKQHLNKQGQDLFSIFFNRLMNTQIVQQKDPQEFINSEMEKQKMVNTARNPLN